MNRSSPSDGPLFPERSVSVFFPMHNEEENIEPSVRKGLEVLPALVGGFEIIVVNDGSSDRTGEIGDRLAAEYPEVRVVHHPKNRGYGGAVKSGLATAEKELVFFTDGDLQFDLSEIEVLLRELDGHDVVVGYRKKRSDPFHRSVNTYCWNVLVRALFGLKLRDIDCAFKLFRREVIEAIGELRAEGALLSTELMVRILQGGFRVQEIGVSHYPRPSGEQSGASLAVILRAFRELFRLRRRIGRI